MKTRPNFSLPTRLNGLLTGLIGLTLLLAACSDEQPSQAHHSPLTGAATLTAQPLQTVANRPAYAGWAVDAYPDMTQEQMTATVRRMKEAGANVIWISHANPARSYKDEREVGLNPAVWIAFNDFSLIEHNDAVEIVKAEKRMLQACEEVGVKAVLSVGYQTQMGTVWSKKHPQDLRRDASGKLWQVTNGNDPYGSVYAPAFQTDLQAYYLWIEFEFVHPFQSNILMLNLADEPLGGDYSGWANREFQHRTGYSFEQVGSDSARQIQLGMFQAGVITDFMKLAAGLWQSITPGLPVTMSFDGGATREDNGLPELESLFREAPANFVLTWDMYPRDRGSLNVALNEDDITRLFFLVRTLSGYSARYERKVWFWSAANSWGLGQEVDQPGTIADAEANLLYLAQLMNQAGGHLEGLAAWNYNIRTQGLYNYSWGNVKKTASWQPDQMFERVSAQFEPARRLMSETPGQPEVLLLKPAEWQYAQIGQNRPSYKQPVVDYARMDVLARNNIVTITAGHWPDRLPPQWAALKAVIVLSPPEFLTEADRQGLQKWTAAGGTVVASLGVAQAILPAASAQWNDQPTGHPYGQGRLFISRQPTYRLFDSTQRDQYQSFWQDFLGLTDFQTGFEVRTRSSYLAYHLSKNSPAPRWPTGWDNLALQRFQPDGTAQLFNRSGWPDWSFKRSEFIFGLAASRP